MQKKKNRELESEYNSFFLNKINIVSCRHEDCLTLQFTGTDHEEEVPAEKDWVLVSVPRELWHQKYSHLWLKLKAEQTKYILHSKCRICANASWSNRDGWVSTKPLFKFGHLWQKWLRTLKGVDCCGSQVPVILFKILQLSGICLPACSMFSCANYVPVDAMSTAWTSLYAHSLFLLLLF